LIFTAGGRFPWGMRQSSSEQSSCGVSACTLIPQESPPSVIISKKNHENQQQKITEPFSKTDAFTLRAAEGF